MKIKNNVLLQVLATDILQPRPLLLDAASNRKIRHKATAQENMFPISGNKY